MKRRKPQAASRRASPGNGARSIDSREAAAVKEAPLAGREVLVCVCGGIAAYKSATLVSRLVQRGCDVTVAMTRAARRFIGEVTFQALSGRPVYSSLWPAAESGDIEHLTLGAKADLIVVAPATANALAKLAGGIADDLVSSALLGAACPVLLAPAMNTRMWQHPATVRNVRFLVQSGYAMIGPDAGWQACREVGPGRMSEPDAIVVRIEAMLSVARGNSVRRGT